MILTVSSKGQVVIPAEVRKRYNIGPGSKLVLVDLAGVLYLVPGSENPLEELEGRFADREGFSSEEFLKWRRADAEREDPA